MSSYNSTFYQLAQQSEQRAEATNDTFVTQDNYFFASANYCQADFYLHATWSDPLINWCWEKRTTLFDKAITLFASFGREGHIPADTFETIGIFYKPDNSSIKRATVFIGTEYDAAQEDSLHSNGLALLGERVECQPMVRRQQNLGFIYDWEKVATPVVNYLANRFDVDMSLLVLQGISMGGYLAARAPAFEPRVKALILDEGMFSVYEGFTHVFPSSLLELLAAGNTTAFDEVLEETSSSTTLRQLRVDGASLKDFSLSIPTRPPRG